MVYSTQRTIATGVYKPTNITGPHIPMISQGAHDEGQDDLGEGPGPWRHWSGGNGWKV